MSCVGRPIYGTYWLIKTKAALIDPSFLLTGWEGTTMFRHNSGFICKGQEEAYMGVNIRGKYSTAASVSTSVHVGLFPRSFFLGVSWG